MFLFCFHSAAYSTSVKIVNTTIKTNHTPEKDHSAMNPAPGICLPVIVNLCKQHKVPYNYAVFPNYMGHFNQRDAQQDLEVYDALVDVRCYELAALFLCSVFIPKCGPGGVLVRPCLSLCMGKLNRPPTPTPTPTPLKSSQTINFRNEKTMRIFPWRFRFDATRLPGLQLISGVARPGNMRRPPRSQGGEDTLTKTRLVTVKSISMIYRNSH